MPIIRILVDGYSLLHAWPELAPGAARHSHRAREALVQALTSYHDASGTPVTVFFDGQGAPPGTPKLPSSPGIEVLFSRAGQTADDMIERTAFRLRDYGDVLVITDDHAERDTVLGFGALANSCATFIAQLESEQRQFNEDLRNLNRREREAYRKEGKRRP